MYVVRKVEGGYQVAWVEHENAPPRTVRVEPYKHRQSAYRKAKELNDAVKDIDNMIQRDGAIIN